MKEYIDFPEGRVWQVESKTKKYGKIEELKEKILLKRIVEFKENYLKLEDNTIITIEHSDWDCCAYGEGFFKNVKLDAVITDIKLVKVQIDDECHDEVYEKVCVNILHNQNIVAEAEAEAGHNGYYLSVVSLVVDEIHFPIINI